MMIRQNFLILLSCVTFAMGCDSSGIPMSQAAPPEAESNAMQDSDVEPQRSRTAAAEDTKVRPRLTHRAGGKLDLTFDDLEFEIDRDADFDRSMLGEEIEAMQGKSIVLRGFILDASVFQQKGIKQFVLVRDNQECCFGPGAYIFHNAQVELVEGKSTEFSIRPVEVEGTLDIRPFLGPGGKCYSVYHITANSVKLR